MRVMLLVAALAGCPSTPPPACITVDLTCAPGYVPTFDNVYANTLAKSCGTNQGGSCHASEGHQGGLVLDDPVIAYTDLLAASQLDPSRNRVDPGNAACSLFIVRTDSPGADYQMPIGDPLSAVERCALVQWVQAGALNGSGQ